MRVAVAVMLLGLLAAMIGKGSPSNLLRLRAKWLVLLGVYVVGSVAVRFESPGAFGILLLSMAAFTAFCFLNALAIRGLLLVGCGLALNLAVTANNHGMPYRPSAVVEAGAFSSRSADLVPRSTVSAHPERAGDQLVVLADVIALKPLREVVSVGDLLIAIGLGLVVFHGTLGDGLRRPRHNARHAVLPRFSVPPEPLEPLPVVPSDPLVALLRATGDASVPIDLRPLDVEVSEAAGRTGDAGQAGDEAAETTGTTITADTLVTLTARLAVARALRGAPPLLDRGPDRGVDRVLDLARDLDGPTGAPA